ncbi:hypothetical protein CMI47_08710 [Candidatus Pacearchaeota archaeon]|nr:hypothetical protein [Candidatus Pacearchaeota archaeon]|tara:strand:+ start:194 stop:556 length:363 start_codon:yes stop_codon:yes gene_type:complete
MRVTKRRLKKIIKEEKARLLREQVEAQPTSDNEHHWPRVDWTNIEQLVDKWAVGEREAFDPGDPSMKPEDLSTSDAKAIWVDQVETASMDMEAELTNRVRKVALATMKEFTNALINGDYT